MKPKVQTYICAAATAVFFAATFLFWWLGHPEYLSYQEQYQLFLFTSDYLAQRASEIGGMADYVSEFVVQFYYVPWMGALGIALVMTLLQVLTAAVALRGSASGSRLGTGAVWMLSVVPAAMCLRSMGDENVLLSFPVALVMALAAVCLMQWVLRRASGRWPVAVAAGAALFLALYWAAGATALLFVAASALSAGGARRALVVGALSLAAAAAAIWAIHRVWYTQYPLSELFLGINYYRASFVHPAQLYAVAAAVLAVALAARVRVQASAQTAVTVAALAVVAVAAPLYVASGIDRQKMEIFRYDQLVRQQRWPQIIRMAERQAPANDFCMQGLNLALAKSGILGETMYDYPQRGIGSLIGRYEYNNTACLISAEIFYHLGMVNSAFRYNFDLQESIMNNRRSGRFLKRMAECQIINGKYASARKYLEPLRHSLFYSTWARNAERYLYDDDRVDSHPEWGEKRNVRFKQEMLYDYPEIEKVFGLLALESGGQNLLAWDYFCAATLLKCDLPTFTGMYHYAPELFGVRQIPRHHQEAIAMYWTFGHQNFDGLPYPVSDAVKSGITALAQAAMQTPNPAALAARFPGMYPVYFLRNQQGAPAASGPKGAERGD